MHRRVLLLALGSILGCSEVPRPRAEQNVLLVTIDTLRADRLGAYGYRNARTPHLDALAREGVLFEEAISQAPLTLPSHASLLTGLLPPAHGVRDNTVFRLGSEATTLAEILKAEGYETAAFVGAFVLDRSFGLDQGFDLYDDAIEGGEESVGTIAERKGEVLTRRFVSWLEKRASDRPFFAWIHFFDPHLPYENGGYNGEVAYVDGELGRVLERVDDDTLVVVTSDHGESLGEHGEKSHGFFVYDATLRIPLLFRSPRSLPSGARIENPVRLVDVLPTILDLVEVPLPEGVQGKSLLPLVSGKKEPDLPVYAECYAPEVAFRWAPLVALREGGYKYIEAPRPELYDLRQDPGETRNLYSSEPDLAGRMRAKLEEEIASLPGSLSTRLQPDAETVERLRSLGYAATEPGPRTGASELPDPKDRLHLWTRLEEIILARGAGRHDEAIGGALRVLEEDPTNLLALELLAGARADSGDRPGAIEAYQRILGLDEGRPLANVLYGNLLWQSGDLEGAEKVFTRAIESDPELARAHRRLGELHLTRGEEARALESFRRAAELSGGDDALVGLGLARALKASGEKAAALKELEALHRRFPTDPKVLAEYAGTLAENGQWDRALALLAEGPDHHDVHFAKSVLLRSRDRMDEALVELDRALALEPSSAVALHDRGVILSRTGRLPEAVEAFERALAIIDAPMTQNALGAALCRMDRCAEAIPHFERAVAGAPGMKEAWENLAAAYALAGRESDARRVEKRIEELSGGGRRLP